MSVGRTPVNSEVYESFRSEVESRDIRVEWYTVGVWVGSVDEVEVITDERVDDVLYRIVLPEDSPADHIEDAVDVFEVVLQQESG